MVTTITITTGLIPPSPVLSLPMATVMEPMSWGQKSGMMAARIRSAWPRMRSGWPGAFGCCPSNEALLDAQQFIVAPTDLAGNNPNPSLRPDVVNQSWGGPGGSQIFEQVIASLRASGIFPAFSAGNNGSSAGDGCGRLGSPGDNPSAFNVGNTDINDNISSSSSRGPNPFTGATGPNVLLLALISALVCPAMPNSSFSGTSMASPHVAGPVALLISLEPQLRGQVEQLEELLRKTAVPRTSSSDL